MEESPAYSSVNLQVSKQGFASLTTIYRWGRFLSITGAVVNSIFVLTATLLFIDGDMPSGDVFANRFLHLMTLLLNLLFFYPVIFLFRACTHLKQSMDTQNDQALNLAFHALKRVFQFFGIFVLVLLIMYGLILLYLMIYQIGRIA